MKISVVRTTRTPNSTGGLLYIDGKFQCVTLEPYDRSIYQTDPSSSIARIKVQDKTCIPYGQYNVTITYSPHFQRDLPLINNVPGFQGVRIHPGNKPSDTEGCILIGEELNIDWVSNSIKTFDKVYPQIQQALSQPSGSVTINIINGVPKYDYIANPPKGI